MVWTARSSTSKSTSHICTGLCYCISIPIGTSSLLYIRELSKYPAIHVRVCLQAS
jgi:hypothetical protein